MLSVGPATAQLTHCTATVSTKGGTILVGARNVSGTLLWGNSSGTETNAFNNAGTCISGTSVVVARECELGAPGTAAAITPPPLCTLYLKDNGPECTAYIRGCTPGDRTAAPTGVQSVTASAPLNSSGGSNPNVSLTGVVPVAQGGTGTTTLAGLRSSIGAAASGANSDITSLSGLTISNLALGNSALHSNTGGDGNTAVGSLALELNTNSDNTAVGEFALALNSGGGDNTAVGYGALQCSDGTGSQNTAVGSSALDGGQNEHVCADNGSDNTAVGYAALGVNAGGSYNVAVGQNALLSNTTGGENTALGASALDQNLDGGYNVAVGQNALQSNLHGAANTAVGQSALPSNTNGGFNTAVGVNALQSNITAGGNTAVGARALHNNDSDGSGAATNNTAVGQNALYDNTDGNGNTALGEGALSNNTSGSDNIAVGAGAGSNVNTGSNNVYIGASGPGDESNAVRIGDVQAFCYGQSKCGINQFGTPGGGSFSLRAVSFSEVFPNLPQQLMTLKICRLILTAARSLLLSLGYHRPGSRRTFRIWATRAVGS
jgi:hypothetical protein